MKSCDRAAIVIQVGIRASKISARVLGATQAVNASVIGVFAGPISIVIRAAWRISERTKIIIERMILLHDDDDVIDFVNVALGKTRLHPDDANKQGQNRCLP
jgi:hypothetical protein